MMADKLRVVLIHYHTRGGGVTRVMQRAIESLAGRVSFCILVGESPPINDPIAPFVRVVDGLGYGQIRETEDVLAECRRVSEDALGGAPDVWHIHNHSLGKNGVQPRLVALLAKLGERILLQPHDFAEDGRPVNYGVLADSLDVLYPFGARVNYAVLNQRDRTFLCAAGVSDECVHLLPNAVAEVEMDGVPVAHPWNRLFVYPCRGIRRKNIGEFLLWAALAEPGDHFAMTLSPQNPTAKPIYDEWVDFAASRGLPVSFDVDKKWGQSFAENMCCADAFITTSVAEGFGLTFMEPWLYGKPLVGRNLPEITADFAGNALNLTSLYDSLLVPLELLDRDELERTVRAEMERMYGHYNRVLTDSDFAAAMRSIVQGDQVEFGALNESMQRQIIDQAAETGLSGITDLGPQRLIDKNRAAVLEHYGLDAYGDRLFLLYDSLMKAVSHEVEFAEAARLLNQFLRPERFNLLRT